MLQESLKPAERQLPAHEPARYIQAYPKEETQATREVADCGLALSSGA
jgi:hypothetical protein